MESSKQKFAITIWVIWVALIIVSCNTLSRENTVDRYPAVSPDGQYIVYNFSIINGDAEKYPPEGLYIINIKGTEKNLLHLHGARASWSPDGRQIVTTNGIYTIKNRMVTDIRPINNDIKPLLFFSWSPDGITILYNSYDSKVFLCDTFFNNIRELPFKAEWARWMKDGKNIVCSMRSPQWTGSEICIIDTLGSETFRLTYNGENKHYHSIAPSPDGNMIAFNCSLYTIYVMNSDGTNLRELDKGMDPTWTPDSRYIVYSKYQQDNKRWSSNYMWKISVDGKEKIQITNNK